MTIIRLGLIGLGKIARDSHLPAIAKNPAFTLTAVATPSGSGDGVPNVASYTDYKEMLAANIVDAVAVCTPTQFHYPITLDCLRAGVDVLLEKPPTATLTAFEELVAQAAAARRVLFQSWHSRFAAGVETARTALAGKTVTALDITWHEDVRHWHPGQDWIWTAGGFGVLDPGINAFSIATRIMPVPLILDHAELDIPAGFQSPITARMGWSGLGGGVDLDWRGLTPQSWTISVTCSDAPPLVLTEGGAKLSIDGHDVPVAPQVEYEGAYAHFAMLLASRTSDADAAPLRLAADAFLIGSRNMVDAFTG